jgi:NAD dependent epimerase/dehydratase
MKLAGRKVLVTGASGFIGSHLTQGLLDAGADVRAFIKYNSMNHRGFLDTLSISEQRAIEVVKGDIRDPHTVQNAVKGTSVVFHLGALIAIPYSYQSPTDVVQTNVEGTLNVALAARDAGVDCMIHTSTSEVYGTARFVPMDESHPLQGQSPYSASKIAADKIVESFYCSYGLPVKIVRPFNAYGPRQSMRAVIPTIINQIMYKKEVVLGNVTSTRDFTFVTDTSRAFMAAASAERGLGEVFNAGSGFEISIGELATRVMALVGRNLPIRIAQERLRTARSEVERLYSDSQKADRILGWKPTVFLEEGLTKTISWIEQHRSLYRPDEYVL